MKFILPLVVCLWLVNAGAAEPPKGPNGDRRKDCAQAMSGLPALPEELMREARTYYQRQNAGLNVDAILGEAKVLGSAADALVISQKPGLSLIRQLGFEDKRFTRVSLRGRELVKIYQVGQFFVVVTRAEDGQEFYLHIVPESLERVAVVQNYANARELKTVKLPRDQGQALYVGNLAVFLYVPTVWDSQGRGDTRISLRQLGRKITKLDFDEEHFGELPLARVSFLPLWARHDEYRPTVGLTEASTRPIIYLDYSAAKIYGNPENVLDRATVPDTPGVLFGSPSTPFWTFVEGYGNATTVYLFSNVASAHHEAYARRLSFRANEGWTQVNQDHLPLKIDLATVRADETPETLRRIFHFQGRRKDGGGLTEKFQMIMPAPGEPLPYPILLKEAKVLFRDKERDLVLLQADHRADQSRIYSPTLGWRNVLIQGRDAIGFLSTYRLKDVTDQFPVPLEYLGTARGSFQTFLFAKMEGAETPGFLVIDRGTGSSVWVPNLKRIQFARIGGMQHFFFWGEEIRAGHRVPTIAAFLWPHGFRLTTQPPPNLPEGGEMVASLLNGIRDRSGVLSEMLDQATGSEKILIYSDSASKRKPSDFNRSTSFGVDADAKDYVITMHPEFDLIRVDFKQTHGTNLRYWIDLAKFEITQFRGYFDVAVEAEGPAAADQFMVQAAESLRRSSREPEGKDNEELDEPEPKRKSGLRVDSTNLMVYRRTPDGAIQNSRVQIDGHLERLMFKRQGSRTYAIGRSHTSGLVRDTGLDFVWDLRANQLSEMVYNRIPTPMYSDEEGEVIVSQGSSEEHPRVFFRRHGEILGREFKLGYNLKNKDTHPSNSFFAFLFGQAQPEEPADDHVNAQEIAKVEREGDLFFITTKPSVDRCSMMFVYNKRRKSLEVAIPNFQRVLDQGKYRFYIGEATAFYPTVIAVFKNASHSYLTHFDFGKVELDTTSPDAITPRDGNIVFRTKSGSERVYDTRLNFFLGTVPKPIMDLLEPIQGKLGSLMNDRIFQSALPGLYERDAVLAEIKANSPLRISKHGSLNYMLVGLSGSGLQLLLDTHLLQYVEGDIEPPPQFRPIWFEIDGTEAAADTKYRGNVATKWRELRNVALKIRGSGYRLIVVLKHADQMLPDGEIQGDSEGDIFANLAKEMGRGDLDVIATSTPSGFEQLQRRKPRFAGQFRRVQRVPALSPAQTVRAIGGFLNEDFGTREVLRPEHAEHITDRVQRLNHLRALPGAAFDIVKQLLPDKNAAAVDDKQIDLALASKTGVPRLLLDKENAAANREAMGQFLKSRVKGIDDEIDQVTLAIFSFVLENNRVDWPIARIMALGPTGTGKSELIQAIAEFLFGNRDALLKISGTDWAQAGTAHALNALIVSHKRQYPLNLIWFDEWDKMHPDNQNVMLSLGDGEIVSTKGEKLSTALSVIYATSNVGADKVQQEIASLSFGFKFHTAEEFEQMARATARATYFAEFDKLTKIEVRNRFTRVLVFPFLSEHIARVIIEDYLNGIQGSGVKSIRERFRRKRVLLRFDESAIAYATRAYLDKLLGGRRVAINIENDMVENLLTESELAGQLPAGVPLRVIYDGERLVLGPDPDEGAPGPLKEE